MPQICFLVRCFCCVIRECNYYILNKVLREGVCQSFFKKDLRE
jgi:hypothetical protein